MAGSCILFEAAKRSRAEVLCDRDGGAGCGRDCPTFELLPVWTRIHSLHRSQAPRPLT